MGPSQVFAAGAIPAQAYFDTTVTWRPRVLGHQAELFVTVNNLFDRDPEPTLGFLIAGASFGNRGLYDLIGRTYTTGVRFKF
jgi:outer membrane receptor protein involved in Fe transport